MKTVCKNEVSLKQGYVSPGLTWSWDSHGKSWDLKFAFQAGAWKSHQGGNWKHLFGSWKSYGISDFFPVFFADG